LITFNANKGCHLFSKLATEMPDAHFFGVIGAYGELFVDRSDTSGWKTALREITREDTWNRRSDQARARAEELDPQPDLDRWCDAIEALAP
jgi:hypothetical protein